MKKAKIIICVILLLCMSTLFVACEYGDPDKLGIGDMSFGQRLLIGLQVAFLGIAMVFLVLIILILFINLLRIILNIDYKKLFTKKKNKEVEATAVTEAKPANNDNETDEEVVAVIMASLMAYYQAEGAVEYKSDLPFRVRSIKEIK